MSCCFCVLWIALQHTPLLPLSHAQNKRCLRSNCPVECAPTFKHAIGAAKFRAAHADNQLTPLAVYYGAQLEARERDCAGGGLSVFADRFFRAERIAVLY